MIRAALVDDHAIIRRGLRELLSETNQITVVGEAADYAQWAQLSRETEYDVLVLDLNLPGRGGMDILSAALERQPGARVLILSNHMEDQFGVRSLKAGAMGYLNKNAEPQEIIEAVKKVSSGQVYVNAELSALLVNSIRSSSDAKDDEKDPHHALSEREMQTLLFIARGTKRASIAKSLALSPKTVSVYRSRIMQKLGLVTDAAIAAYAVRHQLVD